MQVHGMLEPRRHVLRRTGNHRTAPARRHGFTPWRSQHLARCLESVTNRWPGADDVEARGYALCLVSLLRQPRAAKVAAMQPHLGGRLAGISNCYVMELPSEST